MAKYLSIAFIFFGIKAYSQFGPQQIITTTANGTQIIFSADLDGDGYKDVLSANMFGGSITWYKNIDGQGNFGPENRIALLNDATSVFAADLDGDNDLDILATSSFLNLVVWYENLDGQGNFSTPITISNQLDGAFSVVAADIDADGDMDLAIAYDADGLYWFENVDGQGDFSGRVIDNTIENARSVVVADMDGDGDLDVVGNGRTPNLLYWVENMDGLGTFGTKHIINNEVPYKNVVYVEDVDNDGDMDVFVALISDNEVAWYKNLDGLGIFGPKISISNTLVNAWTVYSADLDNDGDMDVLATSAETFGGEVVWFENLDGLGSFSTKKTISTEVQSPRSVIAADIDNDGDMDVIASSQNDDKIAWYENQTIMGITDNETNAVKIYPNPTKDILFLEKQVGQETTGIILYDTFGRILLNKEGNVSQINLSNFIEGIYYLKLKTKAGDQTFKVIKT